MKTKTPKTKANAKSKSKDVVFVVTEKDYARELARGIPPDETFAPGVHVGRRGGFLERHGLTPEQARQIPRPSRPLSPRRITEIREGMELSQTTFASILRVSPRTVQDWEQGRRTPTGAALTLLVIAEKHPDVLLNL